MDPGHATELLAFMYPFAFNLEDVIRELQQVPLSGGVKARVFGEWATFVGASPTPYDFERVARTTTPASREGASQ